jgi:hypothetical protein
MEDMTKALRKRMEDVDPELIVNFLKNKGWIVSELTEQGLYYAKKLADNGQKIGLLHIPTLKGEPGYYSALQLVLDYLARKQDRDIMDVAEDFVPKAPTPTAQSNFEFEKEIEELRHRVEWLEGCLLQALSEKRSMLHLTEGQASNKSSTRTIYRQRINVQ